MKKLIPLFLIFFLLSCKEDIYTIEEKNMMEKIKNDEIIIQTDDIYVEEKDIENAKRFINITFPKSYKDKDILNIINKIPKNLEDVKLDFDYNNFSLKYIDIILESKSKNIGIGVNRCESKIDINKDIFLKISNYNKNIDLLCYNTSEGNGFNIIDNEDRIKNNKSNNTILNLP